MPEPAKRDVEMHLAAQSPLRGEEPMINARFIRSCRSLATVSLIKAVS